MRIRLFIFLVLKISSGLAQDTLRVSEDIFLVRISPHALVHVSWFSSEEFGRFSSNGLIVHNNGEALLFDTPMSDVMTKELVTYINTELNLKITGFIPNHFHNDCTEGMDVLHEMGVTSFAGFLTNEILKANGLEAASRSFDESLSLSLGEMKVECFYPGAAHSPDNIIAWVPSEKILFGGCMVKSNQSTGLGNIADADLKLWPQTIEKIISSYPDAEIVIPGHGNFGDKSLLMHSLKLLK